MEKNQFLDEAIKKMRIGYMKELTNYKEQLFKHEKYPETFEPIKATYFSALEVLDDDLRTLLNDKLDYATDDFNFKLLRMQKMNSFLEDKIRKFEQLCNTQNVGISIHELSADDIVMKLKIVEQSAQPIWTAFHKYFGSGFFNKMIEKEFGINPDTHEEIGHKFGEEVNNIRIDVNNKFEQIKKETNNRIDIYQTTIRKLRSENEYILTSQEEEIEKAKAEIKKLCEEYYINIEAAHFKKYDEEKQELYEHIKLIESLMDSSKSPYKIYKPNVHELINNIGSEGMSPKKPKPLARINSHSSNKEFEGLKNSENWPQANQGAIDKLRQENLNITKDLLNLKYLKNVAEKDYERVKEKLKVFANDIAFLKEANHKLRIESDNHEKELKSIKLSNKETKEYAESLESERSYLKSHIENLIKLMPKHKLSQVNQLDKQSPFSIINLQTHKAKHQVEHNYVTMVTGLFRDSQVHIATNTDLSGLDKEIVDRADIKGEIEIPRFDRQTQAEPDKPEI